jgi:hypothetical protein
MPVRPGDLNASIKVLIKDVPEAAIGCAAALTMLTLKVVSVGMTGWVELALNASLAVMALVVVVAFVAALIRVIALRNRRN